MKPRMMIAALSLSAAGLIGIAVHEGYTDRPVIPVPGDVPTIGFGDTHNVRPGDRTDPVRALVRLGEHASTFERAVRRCAPVPMHQHEFDVWVSFTYNVGETAFCTSTAARLLREKRYAEACDQLLRWVHVKGVRIQGLASRRERERAQCLGPG